MKKSKNKERLSAGAWFIIILIVIIVLVIVGFTIGKQFRPYEDPYEYNHFKFYKNGDLWVTQVQMNGVLHTIPFYYHPSQLEDIMVEENIAAKVFKPTTEMILITLDPDSGSIPGQAGVQISRLTGERFGVYKIPTFGAITRMDETVNETNQTIRIATCNAASDTISVIYIKIGKNNIIHSDGECVILEGATAEDTVRVAERFDYEILGIM
jgi:hypothetical protein